MFNPSEVNCLVIFLLFISLGKKTGAQNVVNSYHCTQAVEDALQLTTFINEGYMKLKPILYPCTIEFSLMCLTVSNDNKIKNFRFEK